MTEETLYAAYPVFKARPERLDGGRDVAIKEAVAALDEHAARVRLRGAYSTTGFSASADLVLWLVASSADHVQDALVALRRTALGRALDQREMFLGVVRPAEFTRDHLPAFVQGKEPKRYMTVYPFVRTPEWYLLDASERGAYLRAHGEAGREFPDVWANTTSAFGLGDYEWILCFEADDPGRLVDLIRRLRATEARRYTKLEIPFFTGIRKDLADALTDAF
ncbi:MAG TPA: hydrogen peroxide-dependent heme synthase [Actinomycetota bacterium]|nr:hydrogen peroxide-dependent heme synthase [Actinomycetota bacterium]